MTPKPGMRIPIRNSQFKEERENNFSEFLKEEWEKDGKEFSTTFPYKVYPKPSFLKNHPHFP